MTAVDRFRFTPELFMALVDSGAWPEDVRVELLDGDLIAVSPAKPPHSGPIVRLTTLLVKAHADDVVRVQMPIRVTKSLSIPEPDLALTRAGVPLSRDPAASDLLLVVEVMNTTHAVDQGIKLRLYARDGIPEVWLLDVPARVLYRYRDPRGDRYVDITTFGPGARAPVPGPSGAEVPVGELFVEEDEAGRDEGTDAPADAAAGEDAAPA